MIYARGTVKRVYKQVSGGVLAQALTSSWTQGGTVLVEAATDFSPDGGDGFFEDEAFSYASRVINASDEPTARDSLTGVIRDNPVAHAVGSAIQEGSTETVEKMVDVEVDGELFTGIPVDASVYAYLRLGTYVEDEMPVVALEFDDDGLGRVVSAPLGAVPSFDDDGEVLPPIDEMPPPIPGGKKPEAPTGFSLTPRNTINPDGSYTHYVDATYTHSGLYDDGSEITGLHFRADFYDGATKRFTVEAGSALAFTQQVEGNKTYDVELFALDFANTESDPATDDVSTSPDSSAPATPTGLALVGGVGGGGFGIIYAQWTPNTEADFSHYEVHASTSSGFTPSASTLIATTAATTHPVNIAFNGSVKTTFGYTTTIYVKLKAVDRSTNASSATAQVSATAEEAASADITDIQSDNFSTGVAGWRFTKAGNLEANNGTFRGSLVANTIVSMSASGGGIVITGSTNEIALGAGLKLDGDGNGSITFGSNCTISGAGAGAIDVGTGIDLLGSGTGQITVGSALILDGAGTGVIQGGTIRTAASGSERIELSASLWNTKTISFVNSSNSQVSRIDFDTSAQTLGVTASASGYKLILSGNAGITVSGPVTTTAGSWLHIGEATNSVLNFLSLRNTAGTPDAPSAGSCRIFYDANTGANGALRARNPTSTQTLCSF